MNKVALAEVVQQKLGITKKSAEDAVDAIFDSIMQFLGKGEEVAISGFGTFMVKERSARAGVNPRTKERIQVAATKTPKFRAGKSLKEAVK